MAPDAADVAGFEAFIERLQSWTSRLKEQQLRH